MKYALYNSIDEMLAPEVVSELAKTSIRYVAACHLVVATAIPGAGLWILRS
jgi:hypothetical protein